MMHAFRAFAKTWFAKVLLGVLLVSFAIWGAHASFDTNLDRSVVKAGDHIVRDAEFKRVWDSSLKGVSQQQGRPVTSQEAVKAGLDRDILDQMATGNALWELVRRIGVRPSDKLVLQQITKLPAFLDPVTRVFSAKVYEDQLRSNGFTAELFESGLRDELAENHFATGVGAGLTTPKLYTAVLATLSLEERDAQYFSIDPRVAGVPAPPTDAQLMAFMRENAERLRRPEMRTISLVRFSAAALAPTLPVDEALVRKQYEQTKAAQTVPETRSFVQIAVKSPAEAQQVAQRLAAGQDPAAVARAVGAQAIPYTNAQQSTVADPRIGQAAFALQEGQVSQPVQSATGPAIIKVLKVTAGKAASFEEARPAIEQRLREAAAAEKVYADAAKYGDVHASGADLGRAAAAVGAKIYTLGPLTADGRDQFGRQVTGLTERMLKDAFSTPQGGDTDLIDLSKGEYYALRVDKVTPAALPPLAEIRQPLMQAWMQREVVTRMQARADQLAARVRAGEPMEKVAASAGLQVKRVSGVSRVNAGQNAALGQAFLGTLFQKKPNDVFTAQGPGFAMSVVKVAAVRPGNPGFAAAVMQAGQNEMNKQLFTDVGQLVRDAAKARIKPKVSRERALRAIGVAPETAGSDAAPTSDAPAQTAP